MEYANATPAGVIASPQTADVRYCLYARKSTESDEKQALSIDSQIKEMLAIAEREKLNIIEIRRESHSAKAVGQRPVFNSMIDDIRLGKFTGILTWAPDRLSRNAGDLGALVDLMDQKLLREIKTYGQRFANNPNEKFLLMILCSQAKLENDNKSLNVKRGLRTRVEMGLWPAPAPTGYLNEKRTDRKGYVLLDPKRAPIIKHMFEKVAHENYSGRQIYLWLKKVGFTSTSKKPLALGNVYRLLRIPFYYGRFEYPKNSGKWYTGKHTPIITKELFDKVQEKINENLALKTKSKEFAFTKLMKCGLCGSGITADEKIKTQKNGNVHRYVYYGCTRFHDKSCKNTYLREEELIRQLQDMMDQIDLDEIEIKQKIKSEIERHKRFEAGLLGKKSQIKASNIDMRNYAKYILDQGTIIEKRELLSCLKSKIVLKDKLISLEN
jgi:DNA invertase Pin-like site-specific DNA recombinase